MDWDIEMDDAGVADSETLERTNAVDTSQPDQLPDTDAEDESRRIVPNKIHLRGLDTLTTADIKSYVSDNYGVVDRVEWIDDTSANAVFSSDSLAQAALVALSDVPIVDPTQLPPLDCVPAKPLASKPDIHLQIRFAVVGDKKQAGAASRSRFYLLHPEYDPEERRRRQDNNRKYRDRDGGDYRQRRNGRRREDDEIETFDASLYDDDEATLAERSARQRRERGESPSRGIDTDYAHHNRAKELFPDRAVSARKREQPPRGRSASPARDQDGDERMDEARRGIASSSGNRDKAISIKDRLRGDAANRSKELFPAKIVGKAHMDGLAEEATILLDRSLGFPLEKGDKGGASVSGTRDAPVGDGSLNIRGLAQQRGPESGFAIKGAASANVRELFPDRFGANSGKELFVEKLDGRGRRRQRAEDLFH